MCDMLRFDTLNPLKASVLHLKPDFNHTSTTTGTEQQDLVSQTVGVSPAAVLAHVWAAQSVKGEGEYRSEGVVINRETLSQSHHWSHAEIKTEKSRQNPSACWTCWSSLCIIEIWEELSCFLVFLSYEAEFLKHIHIYRPDQRRTSWVWTHFDLFLS